MDRRSNLRFLFREVAGWGFVSSLFYAPWDYGATGAAAMRHLNWLLGVVLVLYLLERFVGGGQRSGRRRFVASDGILLALIALILIFGWSLALNAHGILDADYGVFFPVSSPWRSRPGSSDYALSVAFMGRMTALLGGLWVVTDLARSERWLLRIVWALGLAGGSIALLGLMQKASGAQVIFWQSLEPDEAPIATFFGTFYYHGNAGAFLNLALPAILGLTYRYVTRPSRPLVRALWVTLSVVIAVAVISDTSRMGQLVALLIVGAMALAIPQGIARRLRHLEPRTIVVAVIAGALALWAVARVSHLDRSLGRWDETETTWSADARWLADQVALQALPQAGLIGFGPGAFSAVFPSLIQSSTVKLDGSWLFLHDDYLQTLLEWGALGGLLWAGLFFGGMAVAILSLAKSKGRADLLPRQRLCLQIALIALGGVALHAAVDFPLQIASIQLYAMTYLGISWGSGTFGRRCSS